MVKKSQLEIISELQHNSDVIILNNPLSAPKLVRKLSKNNEMQINEVYIPKLFYDIISRITPGHLELFERCRRTVRRPRTGTTAASGERHAPRGERSEGVQRPVPGVA